MIVMYPYKMGSASAKVLAQQLECKRVYSNRKYRYRMHHDILNWGSSVKPAWDNKYVHYINSPCNVKIASNKYHTLNKFRLHDVSLPVFTTDINVAKEWIDANHLVYCRTNLTGNSGKDIVISDSYDALVNAPLYTKGVDADVEYRVHVFNGEVIDYVKKATRRGEDKPSHLVRNYAKGWVFIREGIILPDEIISEAIKAVRSIGLCFGAVDIATIHGGGVCVYEVNTAPGLQGSTIDAYVNAIHKYLSEN